MRSALRSLWRASVAAALSQLGCGREDIELSSAPRPTPAPEDCSAALPEGLVGARPPMGWNGYNAFGCSPELDEEKVKAVAQAMTDSGMQSAGYSYVNLDICWQEEARSEQGERVEDSTKLPGGFQELGEWVHARGFSFGVYSHVRDCEQMPGGQGYEAIDAASYATWGVDYLKYTYCGDPDENLRMAVEDLATALAEVERPITVSLAARGFQEWMRDSVQLWRTPGDAEPTWEAIVDSIDSAVPLAAYARPGSFNDPDMLEIGNGDLNPNEERVQFSVWSILSAPLLAGNDLTDMDDETRAILTNSDVIALNQDPLGLQAAVVREVEGVQVLAKPLAACGERAVVLWNRSTTDTEVSLVWQDLWLEPQTATVRDLWGDASLDVEDDEGFSAVVPAQDAVALRVSGVEPPLPQGRVYLSDLDWTYVTNGWGPVERDQSNGEEAPLDGAPIRLRGAAYDKGLGVHGPSLIRYRLGKACSRFVADIGIDDDQDGGGSAQFEVSADGEVLFRSGRLTGASPAVRVNVNVRDRRELRLFVGVGGDTFQLDHAVWAGALLECDL